MADVIYGDVPLSSNVCPSCEEASGQQMTLDEWQSSSWGVPGSSGRYCEADCHCILVPVEMLPELPVIGAQTLLRGDKDTDILAMVDIHPNEQALKDLMDEWNKLKGKLPPEIYAMPVDDILAYLQQELGYT